jgi:hypothetical protein
LHETTQFDITTQDQFSTVAAKIEESDNGDYIEFYGTYNGDIIEQFINDLNSNGYNYMLLHDLVISEYEWPVLDLLILFPICFLVIGSSHIFFIISDNSSLWF